MLGHPPRLHFGAFEIDVKAGEVWKHGRRIRLQEQPYRVLLALLEVPGETVTRQELRERLWPAETFVDFDNGLNNVINRLRGALGDSATSPRLIETVGRRGYRFIGEVRSPIPDAHLGEHAEPLQANQGVSVGEPMAEPVAAAAGLEVAHEPSHLPGPDQPDQRLAVVDEHTTLAFPAVAPSGSATAGHWRLAGAAVAVGVLLTIGALSLVGPARLAVWLGGYGFGTALSASPGIRSLGILPLADPTDPPDDLFAYGMVNAVITELSRFQALKVVSPTSEGAYEDQPARSPRELARELGVDTLLRGSVTRNESHVGVTLELIDGTSGRVVWNQSFTRPTADRLSLRSEIVRDVVQQVQTRLTPTVQPPVPGPVTTNVRAYEAYLRGQFETLRRNPRAFARAVTQFSHALALDADYAPAHAGLAFARLQQSSWAGSDHPRQHIEEVRAAISKALALDPNLAEAHVALAMASRFYNWDWIGAEAAVKRAIQLKPSSAMAHNEYTRLLMSLGRFPEALAEAQRTVALDPHAPVYWLTEGIVLFNLRRMEEAEARYQRAIELEPEFSSARRRLVRVYLIQRKIPEARAAFRELDLQPGRSSIRLLRAQFEAMAGNPAEARRLLASVDDRTLVRDLPTAAAAHLALGDRQAALAALRRAVTERAVQPLSFAAPELDGLRADPAFTALLTTMRLPTGSVGALVAPTQQHAMLNATVLPSLGIATH
jgi:TolB-like protein/DNA-binding winged helix-turn-helix (wHTH) protein/Tfp pilus assembly protein PilF